MQNAVLHHFYDAEVTIKFTNRTSNMLFNQPCFEWIQEKVNRMPPLYFDWLWLMFRIVGVEITARREETIKGGLSLF
jgi:hypothetical protein